MTIRIVIDEKDFENLVRGKVIVKENGECAIVLSDIGWDRMFFHIERAMRDAGSGDLV